MAAIDPRIERVLVKLARVRERNIATFGAGTHRYQLAPPLTEAAVLALESAHRIELPADYRAFRVGLFGLDKLADVDGSVARLEQKLAQAIGAER